MHSAGRVGQDVDILPFTTTPRATYYTSSDSEDSTS